MSERDLRSQAAAATMYAHHPGLYRPYMGHYDPGKIINNTRTSLNNLLNVFQLF